MNNWDLILFGVFIINNNIINAICLENLMKLLKNIVLSSTLMETVVGTFQDFKESNNNKKSNEIIIIS